MQSAVKISLVTALIGGLVWSYSKAKDMISKFSVDLESYGKPVIKNFLLTVPLQLRFNNPTPVPINVDLFHADVYVWKDGSFIKGAIIDQAVTIPKGKSVQTVTPQIFLDKIFGGNIINTTAFIANLFTTKSIRMKIDYTAYVKGVAVVSESYIDNFPLS